MEAEFLRDAMERLVVVVQDLSLARDVAAVMALVCHAARVLTGADGVSFVLREGDMCYYADEEASAPLWKGQRFPMSACMSGWAMLHRQHAVIADIYTDPRIPIEVAFHPSTLRRAILNLVQNALEAMTQSGTLTLGGQSTAAHVQLQVRDTGSGMSVEQLSSIFEPLYTTKPGGTGLGLYIVQEIVVAHGGQVTVESGLGQGTTFTLTLPRTVPPGPGSPSP